MAARRPDPDAREVDRVEGLFAPGDSARAEEFLARCVPGSTWRVFIRTADVEGKLIKRLPLGTFKETDCTCLSLRLALPVPVEPGLRIAIEADDAPGLSATGVVRPWPTGGSIIPGG